MPRAYCRPRTSARTTVSRWSWRSITIIIITIIIIIITTDITTTIIITTIIPKS